MKIEIDQSGKIENTNKPTVIGFSNSKNKTMIIYSTEKQKLQRYFRKFEKSRMFIYIVFAALVCLILRYEREIDEIIIDNEYPGQEALIKNYILVFLRKMGKEIDKSLIHFKSIGKRSKAHKLVYQAYGVKRADRKIICDDVLKFIK